MQTKNWYAYLLGEARVYSDPNKRKQFMYCLYIAFGGSAAMGLISYLIYHDVSKLILVILGGLGGGLAGPLATILASKSPYHVVGSKGLIYFSGQYTIYTPWENIDRIEEQHGKTPPSILLKQLPAALTLEEAVVYRQQATIVNGISPIKIADPEDTRARIALPSSPSRQKTALGQDILHHAPHLA